MAPGGVLWGLVPRGWWQAVAGSGDHVVACDAVRLANGQMAVGSLGGGSVVGERGLTGYRHGVNEARHQLATRMPSNEGDRRAPDLVVVRNFGPSSRPGQPFKTTVHLRIEVPQLSDVDRRLPTVRGPSAAQVTSSEGSADG